jgi:hypothetical protein
LNRDQKKGFQSSFKNKNSLNLNNNHQEEPQTENFSKTYNDDQEKIIFIPLNRDKIQQIAFDISRKNLSVEELHWFISENELRIAHAFVTKENPLTGPLPNSLKIKLSQIEETPKTEDIKKFAENVFIKKLPKENLHWELAIRSYIWEKISNLDKKNR